MSSQCPWNSLDSLAAVPLADIDDPDQGKGEDEYVPEPASASLHSVPTRHNHAFHTEGKKRTAAVEPKLQRPTRQQRRVDYREPSPPKITKDDFEDSNAVPSMPSTPSKAREVHDLCSPDGAAAGPSTSTSQASPTSKGAAVASLLSGFKSPEKQYDWAPFIARRWD